MSDNIYIHGFGLQGYRSFGESLQRIGPFSKVNLFIGQNNSGKSNILSHIHDHYFNQKKAVIRSNNICVYRSLDLHNDFDEDGLSFTLAYRIDEPYLSLLTSDLNLDDERLVSYVKAILTSEDFSQNTDCAWFTYRYVDGFVKADDNLFNCIRHKFASFVVHEQNSPRGQYVQQVKLARALGLNNRSGYSTDEIVETILRKLSPAQLLPQECEVGIIPAFRKVGEPSKLDFDHSGEGLINKLAQLQDPDYDEPELKTQFEQIVQFLEEVTGNSTARLRVPHNRDKILVKINDRELPLESLGTGIHEVIILAAAATILQNQVVCVEEPELHLHPLLQKKLIRYLAEKTNNQYFISTHSAHLLDTPEASIFHVQLKNGQSEVRFVKSDHEKSLICNDLGYKASDILQTNSVIWVEGPSDRTYLNHWIQAVDSSLIEGVHYSIMFYGGRLLSHLSANDPEIEDFISLRRLNRHISILMDSDRDGPGKHINTTKQRVRKEFDKGPGFAWVTKGREVENYVDADTLEEAAREVHPSLTKLVDKGNYDNRLKRYKVGKSTKSTSLDKVKIAHKVANRLANLEVLDLKERVKELVAFIREANAIERQL